MKSFKLISAILAASMLLAGCGKEADNAVSENNSVNIDDSSVYAEFTNGMPENWECADGWTNGSMFNVTWRKDNVTFDDGKMQLIIDKDLLSTGDIPYAGGEFRSKDFYGFGRYV